MNWTWFHRLGSPKWFYEISGRWLPWLALAAVILLGIGLVWRVRTRCTAATTDEAAGP